MKLRAVVFVIALFATVWAAEAQEVLKPAKAAQHHHYQVIDVGTFGGPNSYFTFISQTLNKHGAATGFRGYAHRP